MGDIIHLRDPGPDQQEPTIVGVLMMLLAKAHAGELSSLAAIAFCDGEWIMRVGLSDDDQLQMLGALELARAKIIHSIEETDA